MTTPTKFEVHPAIHTNMTSDYPRMTSDDPWCTSKEIFSEWLHPPSFKSIRSFDPRGPQASGCPQMTRKYQLRNLLWMKTTSSKFQVHTTLYTNMQMTPDDLRWPQNLINSWGCGDAYTHQVPSSYNLRNSRYRVHKVCDAADDDTDAEEIWLIAISPFCFSSQRDKKRTDNSIIM